MDSRELTGLLETVTAGDASARGRLLEAVYPHLHTMAELCLNREDPGHTLQATALVHDAFMKLIDQGSVTWQNRNHFFAVAAQAMRRILVDHARAKHRLKRGGRARRLELAPSLATVRDRDIDLIALDEALRRLGDEEPVEARIVEMRFFAGLTEAQIADVLGVSERTVARHWTYARAWLFREIAKGDPKHAGVSP